MKALLIIVIISLTCATVFKDAVPMYHTQGATTVTVYNAEHGTNY